MIKSKLNKIDPKFVYEDLLPLVESPTFLNRFVESYKDVIDNKIDLVLQITEA